MSESSTSTTSVDGSMMWAGELAHPALNLSGVGACSVHLSAAGIDAMLSLGRDAIRPGASAIPVAVTLLRSGSWGGAWDDASEWFVRPPPSKPELKWLSLDWVFSTTFGSERTLRCLLRVKPQNDGSLLLDIMLPADPSAAVERPSPPPSNSKKDMAGLRASGRVLSLERCPMSIRKRSEVRLGTSIQRAVAGLLRQATKVIEAAAGPEAAAQSRGSRDGSDDDDDGNAFADRLGSGGSNGSVSVGRAPDALVFRLWHLRLERTCSEHGQDAFWSVHRARCGLAELAKDWPLLTGDFKPEARHMSWLRDLQEADEDRFGEDFVGDALDALMERAHDLGFITAFVDGDSLPPAVADHSPIVVYSLAVGMQYVPSLRLSRLKQQQVDALAHAKSGAALNGEVNETVQPAGLQNAFDSTVALKRNDGIEAHVQAAYGNGLSRGRDGRLQALALQKRCHKLRSKAQSSRKKAALAAAVEEPADDSRVGKTSNSSSSSGSSSRSAVVSTAAGHLSDAEVKAMRAARCFIVERRQHWQAQDELAITSLIQPESVETDVAARALKSQATKAPSKMLPKGRKLGSSYPNDDPAVTPTVVEHQKGSSSSVKRGGSSIANSRGSDSFVEVLRRQRLNHVLRLHVASRKSFDSMPARLADAGAEIDGITTSGWVSNARLRRFYQSLPPSGARRYRSTRDNKVAHPDAVMVGASASGDSSLSPLEEELLAELRAVSNASAAAERWQRLEDDKIGTDGNNASLLENNEGNSVNQKATQSWPADLAHRRAARFGFTPVAAVT